MVSNTTKSMLQMRSPCVGKVEIYASASEVVRILAADSTRWDLILLDLDVPGATGLSLAAQIRDAGLARITCVLTGAERPDFVSRVRRDGFQGYILKSSPTSELDASLQSALLGRKVFPTHKENSKPVAADLTKRQREALQLAGAGWTSKEIARELQVAPGTVDNHIYGSIAALGVRTRAEAVAKALMLGMIRGQETARTA